MAALEYVDSWPSASEVGDFIRRNTDWDFGDQEDGMLLSKLPHCAVSVSRALAANDKGLVATAAAVRMGPGPGDVAFLAYVCVDKSTRRQGLARRIVKHTLRRLKDQHSVQRAMLVATPQAEPLYRELGFADFACVRVKSYKYTRMKSALPSPGTSLELGSAIETALAILAEATDGDMGDSRSVLLRNAVCDHKGIVEVASDGGTCCFVRRSERECRLGPLVASSMESGLQVLNAVTRLVTSLESCVSLTAMVLVRQDSNFAELLFESAGFEASHAIPLLHLNCGSLDELSICRALSNPRYLTLSGFEHL
jgi:GNAT superfamily N-acetyltransferase